MLVSVLLIIPIYVWCKSLSKRGSLTKEVNEKEKSILFWIFALFILALSVRIPSVLLFGEPYEKTPLIYLTILTILFIEKKDVSAFGFKIRNLSKSLLWGLLFFLVLGGLMLLIFYPLIYVFTNQIPIQFYNVLPFLLILPFMTLCVGISEEGLFRGYMQTHLEKLYTFKKAILFQAVLFGVWHFVWDLHPFNPISMATYVCITFFIGLLFGYFYSKTKNLAPLAFAHGLYNSVPQGIVENEFAFDIFETTSFVNQILVWFLPYVVSVTLTFFFIKYLVKEI